MKIRKLIDFLPSFYKEKDSYKVNGKGILERYLEIFGNYFEEYVISDTELILDIIDIDKTPEIYLNYLWQFLGEMPFAKSNTIDPDKWKIYFNSFHKDSTIRDLSKLWILSDRNRDIQLDVQDVRKLLKYSISLFKIRGTQRFFEILFRIYGFDLKFLNNTSQTNGMDYYGSNGDYQGSDVDYYGRDEYLWETDPTLIDSEDLTLDKISQLDNFRTCNKCIKISVMITGHNYTSQFDEGMYDFYITCHNIFKRFLPINTSVHIDFGFNIDFGYKININNPIQPDSGFKELEYGVVKEIPVKIDIIKTWGDSSIEPKFLLGYGYKNSEGVYVNVRYSTTVYTSGAILKLKKEGTYFIKCVEDPNVIETFDILRKSIESYLIYHIGYDSNIDLKLSKDNPIIRVPIRAFYQVNDNPEIKKYLSIRRLDTYEVIEPNEQGYCEFVTNDPGIFRFNIVDYPIKQLTLNINQEPEKFRITFHDPNTDDLIQGDYVSPDILQSISTRIKIHRDYPGPVVRLISFYENINEEPYYTVDTNDYSNGSRPHTQPVLVNYMRISCRYDPKKLTSQSVVLHTTAYNPDQESLIPESEAYNTIFPGPLVNMKIGGYFSGSDQWVKGKFYKSGDFIEDPNYQYSDYIDISNLAGQEITPGTNNIPTTLQWNLIASMITCYEISRPDVIFGSGEIFTTRNPGTYNFKTSLSGDIFPLKIVSSYNGLIDWTFSLTPNQSTFMFGPEGKLTITIQLIGRLKSSHTSSNFGIILNWLELNYIDTSVVIQPRIKNSEGLLENFGDPILISNSGYSVDGIKFNWVNTEEPFNRFNNDDDGEQWFIETGIRRTISYTLNTPLDDNISDNTVFYHIYLENWDYLSRDIEVNPYIAPDVLQLYLKPTDSLDPGWISPNWATAKLNDSNNSPAKALYDIKHGIPSFQVLVKGGTSQNFNTRIDIFLEFKKEDGSTELSIISKDYELGDVIDSISKEGSYIIALSDLDTSKYRVARIDLIKNVIYQISCTPEISALDAFGKATTIVKVITDVPVDPINLRVKPVTEKVWYDNGTEFTVKATGEYNFHCYGDTSRVVTFKVLAPGVLSTQSISWSADDDSDRTLNMALPEDSSWYAEVIDVDN